MQEIDHDAMKRIDKETEITVSYHDIIEVVVTYIPHITIEMKKNVCIYTCITHIITLLVHQKKVDNINNKPQYKKLRYNK